jgi:hypothetical protein
LDIKNILNNLSPREKILLYSVGVLAFILLIYMVAFVPLLNARKQYEFESKQLEGQFSELKSIAEKYIAYKQNHDELRSMLNRKKSLSVLTYLENVSESSGIRDNIEYIKPKGNETKEGITKDLVEIKIDAIEIPGLIQFLYNIEDNRKGLVISYLRLKPFFKEKGKADAIIGITDISVN